MPTQIDVVNQVLNELGRLPVSDINDDNSSILISNKIDVLYPELLQRTDWNFAIAYVTDNTPLTTRISPEYLFNYQLPPNYDRMDRVSWLSINFGWVYRIIDDVIITNVRPIQYYYVVNDASLSVISETFYRALVLYVASASAPSITNNTGLVKYLKTEYIMKLNDAIRQNDMDRMIVSTPYNDFDRTTYI